MVERTSTYCTIVTSRMVGGRTILLSGLQVLIDAKLDRVMIKRGILSKNFVEVCLCERTWSVVEGTRQTACSIIQRATVMRFITAKMTVANEVFMARMGGLRKMVLPGQQIVLGTEEKASVRISLHREIEGRSA